MPTQEAYMLPVIDPDDFDSFRNIPTRDLPGTYAEWLNIFVERKIEYGRAGYRIVEIKVNSHEFFRYLDAKKESGNLKNLADFTREKSLGNHY